MKNRTKDLLLSAYSKVLSALLVLLGFASCSDDSQEIADEYGTPYATFEVKGKVVDESNQPLEKVEVLIKERAGNDSPDFYPVETLQTDTEGTYEYQSSFTRPEQTYRVVCQDPSGTYQADSVEFQIDPVPDPENPSGWHEGDDSREINFTLKKKTTEAQESHHSYIPIYYTITNFKQQSYEEAFVLKHGHSDHLLAIVHTRRDSGNLR